MDSTMTAGVKGGPTRYAEEVNKEWLRRTSNVSSDLVKPATRENIRTRRIINRLEEIAMERKEPTVREAIRKGVWKYRRGHFGKVVELNLEREKLNKGIL